MNLRVVICDDEELARRRLSRLLSQIDGVDLVAEHASAEALLDHVAREPIDVILLDVEMPGITGTDAIALLPDDGPVVIFATAHAEHAVDAFDAGAIDYVLKPVTAERVRKAIERARKRVRGSTSKKDASERFGVSTRNGIVLIDPSSVSAATLDGELVTIHLRDEKLITDLTLTDLEERITHPSFVRVHRRAILNLDHVARLSPIETGGFIAHTSHGASIEVSRAAARELRRKLRVR